jgi:O-antigen ligase
MMLAGASWAAYAVRELPSHYFARLACVGFAGLMLFALALTGGRMGQITWVLLGGIFAVWKWRKLIVIGPLFLALVVVSVPAARERLMQGFGDGEIQTNSSIEETLEIDDGGLHWYTISSGRTFAWPFVLEKIAERPAIGYGRNAMQRTGLSSMLLLNYGESFPHPHNAYLQWIFDNGILGAIPVFALFIIVIRRSKILFDDDSDPTFVAVGGMCLALTLAFLIAGIGSQTFYPREGAVGMWCAIGLMLRVYVQREKTISNSRQSPARELSKVAAV